MRMAKREAVRAWCHVVVTADEARASSGELTKQDFEALARFRFGIRRYLRFSEETVRSHGLTPQHYQLLLALKGFPGRDWATVRELAERLQLRHHSVVVILPRALARMSCPGHRGARSSMRLISTGFTSGLAVQHPGEVARRDDGKHDQQHRKPHHTK